MRGVLQVLAEFAACGTEFLRQPAGGFLALVGFAGEPRVKAASSALTKLSRPASDWRVSSRKASNSAVTLDSRSPKRRSVSCAWVPKRMLRTWFEGFLRGLHGLHGIFGLVGILLTLILRMTVECGFHNCTPSVFSAHSKLLARRVVAPACFLSSVFGRELNRAAFFGRGAHRSMLTGAPARGAWHPAFFWRVRGGLPGRWCRSGHHRERARGRRRRCRGRLRSFGRNRRR